MGDDIGGGFDSQTRKNLLNVLGKIHVPNNLLIMDRLVSGFVNHVANFLALKEAGKFENLLWLDESPTDASVYLTFGSLVIVAKDSAVNVAAIAKLILFIQQHHIHMKYHIIVENLGRSGLYQLNKAVEGTILDFEAIVNYNSLMVNLTSKIKVFNWKTCPVEDDALLVDVNDSSGSLGTYLSQPLKQVNQLADALVQVLFAGDNFKYKLRNIYGKGDHSQFLINLVNDVKFPEYLNANLTPLEIEFYQTKLPSNTDLVVLERNLDFTSVLFNQLTYHGLIDDLFSLELGQIELLPLAESVDKKLGPTDFLYHQKLKHLNFSSIGRRLNVLAKSVQLQFKLKEANSNDLDDIKKIVTNLGTLTSKQDLIKKHTVISESIISEITPEFEQFLNFQNDIFEMDYKSQVARLRDFLQKNYDCDFVLTTATLIAIVNDGIKERDYDWIIQQVLDNYGIEASLSLNKLVEFKILRIVTETSTDFLSSLKFSGGEEPVVDADDSQVGVTGAKDVYKNNYTLIDKFWNLHPEDDEEFVSRPVDDDTTEESLVDVASLPSFALPANTVPLLYRFVESLYMRDFLKYKPVNNLKKRPNWDNLGMTTMFSGATVDLNIDDTLDIRQPGARTPNTQPKAKNTLQPGKPQNPHKPQQEYLIIVIMGGITRSEITAYKYLEQKLERNGIKKKIKILSTGIINNRRLLDYIHNG